MVTWDSNAVLETAITIKEESFFFHKTSGETRHVFSLNKTKPFRLTSIRGSGAVLWLNIRPDVNFKMCT